MVQKTLLTMMAELVLLEYITNGAGSSEREGLAHQPLYVPKDRPHETVHRAATPLWTVRIKQIQ